jgi:hypothetical protein
MFSCIYYSSINFQAFTTNTYSEKQFIMLLLMDDSVIISRRSVYLILNESGLSFGVLNLTEIPRSYVLFFGACLLFSSINDFR